MIIEKLKPPMGLWIEDQDGNIIADEQAVLQGKYPDPKPGEQRFSNSRCLVVKHDVYGERTEDNPSGKIFSSESTINCCGVSISKLILEHGWNINDAGTLFAVLCEGCMNTVMSEIEGYTYNEQPNTCCEYCDTIRPGVKRPLTRKEEKEKGIVKSSLQVFTKRIVVRDETTSIYRVVEI